MNKANILDIKYFLAKKHVIESGHDFRMTLRKDIYVLKARTVNNVTIWKLLLDLLDYFFSNYYDGVKFSFNVWRVRKHYNAVKRLYLFFKEIYNLIS